MSFKNQDTNITVALDIGTSKIACLMVEGAEYGTLRLLGNFLEESQGRQKGIVNNSNMTTSALDSVFSQIERITDVNIQQVNIGIAGKHIKSYNTSANINLRHPVDLTDINRLVEAAIANINLPRGNVIQILHSIPSNFTIDEDQTGIMNPIGMYGSRMTASVHVVTASQNAAKNLEGCVSNCGRSVENFILEPLASSTSTLEPAEKNFGTCLIDIGGGTSDIIVYKNNSILYSATLEFAGDDITSGLSTAIRAPIEVAERMKREHGSCLPHIIEDEQIAFNSIAGKEHGPVSKKLLAEFIRTQYIEIFQQVLENIESADDEVPFSNVVITGGGALVPGVAETAEEVFELPARIGFPTAPAWEIDDKAKEEIMNPVYATCIGLMQYALENRGGQTNRVSVHNGAGIWQGFRSLVSKLRKAY